MKKQKTKGFTLIELLVVIAIIGILATIVLVSLNTARQKARDVRRVADMRQIALALEMYYDDHTATGYPGANATNCGDWADLVTNIEGGGYMTKVPTDPGTGTYAYDTFNNFADYVLRAQLEQAANTAFGTDVDTNPVGGVGGCDCTDANRYYCIQP
jgi:type II secretion system protein G